MFSIMDKHFTLQTLKRKSYTCPQAHDFWSFLILWCKYIDFNFGIHISTSGSVFKKCRVHYMTPTQTIHYCWWFVRNPANQLRLVVFSTNIYKGFSTISSGFLAAFRTNQQQEGQNHSKLAYIWSPSIWVPWPLKLEAMKWENRQKNRCTGERFDDFLHVPNLWRWKWYQVAWFQSPHLQQSLDTSNSGTLPETNSSLPLKIGRKLQKEAGSSSNQPFLGAFPVSFREWFFFVGSCQKKTGTTVDNEGELLGPEVE